MKKIKRIKLDITIINKVKQGQSTIVKKSGAGGDCAVLSLWNKRLSADLFELVDVVLYAVNTYVVLNRQFPDAVVHPIS